IPFIARRSTRGVPVTNPIPLTEAGPRKHRKRRWGAGSIPIERQCRVTKSVIAANPLVIFFSQARLFWKSMSLHEQEHIIAAYSFELGKVERMYIREREVNEILANIDLVLATRVAENIGVQPPQGPTVPL